MKKGTKKKKLPKKRKKDECFVENSNQDENSNKVILNEGSEKLNLNKETSTASEVSSETSSEMEHLKTATDTKDSFKSEVEIFGGITKGCSKLYLVRYKTNSPNNPVWLISFLEASNLYAEELKYFHKSRQIPY